MTSHNTDQKEKIIVPVSGHAFSRRRYAEIITYSLGSCLGVTVYDRKLKVGGMAHLMLPDSRIKGCEGQIQPFQFVDTGVTRLLTIAFDAGMEREHLEIKLAGCANVLNDKGVFNIGQRNYMTARKLLWKNGLFITSESTAGNQSRTIRLDLESGCLYIHLGGSQSERIVI